MEENQSLLDLEVNQEAATNITEAARWGKFLAILILTAFALCVLLVTLLWGRLANQLFTADEIRQPESAYSIGFAIGFLVTLGVIVVILLSFLIKGANRIRNGIRNRDQILFNSGLANIRNYFMMYGVLAIIGVLFAIVGLFKNL